MKRSEMVELIASVHADWQMLTANETMSFPDLEFAEFLLINIENAGMLPPPKEIECVTENLMYCYYKKVDEKKVEGRWVLDRDNSQLWDDE